LFEICVILDTIPMYLSSTDGCYTQYISVWVSSWNTLLIVDLIWLCGSILIIIFYYISILSTTFYQQQSTYLFDVFMHRLLKKSYTYLSGGK